jgi:hypothetical protein
MKGRTRRGLFGTALALSAVLLGVPAPAAAGPLKAGVASLDASWHVGASAGQYASDGTFVGVDGKVDPTTHSVRRASSYGIQSRLKVRALVIEGTNGKRVAIVKNDLYIPQDLLYRRTAQLLEAGDSGITRATLTMAVTHNHSSPYYSATSWGVWAFQDVFDVRFFDYYARRMAAAVEQAARNLRAVRVGASVSYFDKTHRHSFGPAIADDGTPAGYPNSNTDHDMTVVRFDDISSGRPKPYANLVNFSLHPEFLNGNDLISADYLGPLERILDRETKALTVFTQGAVGTAEPERSTYHSIHERLEFTHREYAQAEFGARLMANSIIDTWRDIERRQPEDPRRFVPFSSSMQVGMEDRWFPGPRSHPYPGVSNCRSDKALEGDPQIPVLGLPTCMGPIQSIWTLAELAGFDVPIPPPTSPVDPGLSTDDFQSRGIPVPENYSAPSYTGLQEDVSVHLQAIKLGDILFPICSCEQWFDQSEFIETSTNRTQGDQYLGYDWSKQCTKRPDGDWDCPNPGNTSQTLPPISDAKFQRMRAQVLNDAKGWNDPEYLPWAESEPTDPNLIKGNYTHEELPASLGFKLTVPISMANDYNGYIATYREYQRGDHYRKALTGWGAHSSDYMSSRLVAMGGRLNGGPDLPAEFLQEKVAIDLALNDLRAQNLGQAGGALISAYQATLPNDGPVTRVKEPAGIERFAAAFFTWTGGSNFTDNPQVAVQQLVRGRWVDFADQSGEIPVTVDFPDVGEAVPYLLGNQKWEWTAHFEAFAANFATIGGYRATPTGTYRFLVNGQHRQGGRIVPYQIASHSFRVKAWDGITVEDLKLDSDRKVSFRLGPRRVLTVPAQGSNPALQAEIGPIDYPDSYDSPARFIDDERTPFRDPQAPNDPSKLEWFCFACSFRPWADTGNAHSAFVTFVSGGGKKTRVRAVERGGRLVTEQALGPGQKAFVEAGDVRDAFGNFNGARSAEVQG